MKTAIINGILLTPFRRIQNGGLIIQDGVITEILEEGQILHADRIIDAQGYYVSPGFIDIHSHGGGGHDFMDGTVEAITGAAKSHMEHGTTSIVPTTVTCPDEELFDFFTCYRQVKTQMEGCPNLLGIHLEGPYFSAEQKGAQDPKYLKIPAREDYINILSKSDDIIRMSVAPELPGALELGVELKKRGILPSIGHSDATYQQIIPAFEQGYTHVTHLYSGMSTIRRINAYRYLGVVESAYLIDDMTVEIIADGKHLPPELLKLIMKTKPLDKISLITDSMRGAGMPEGEWVQLGSLKHGQKVVIDGGVAMLADHSSFAGSVCTTDRCVRTAYKLAGIPIEDSVRMITANPAKVIGIEKKKGILAPGMDADICIFDEEVNIMVVIVQGKVMVSNI